MLGRSLSSSEILKNTRTSKNLYEFVVINQSEQLEAQTHGICPAEDCPWTSLIIRINKYIQIFIMRLKMGISKNILMVVPNPSNPNSQLK